MSRSLGFGAVVIAAIVFAGFQQARSKSPDASTKVDGKVIQTVATGESTPEAKEVKVGDKGPAWEGLTGTDDKQHSLKDLKKSKAVAIIFTCNTCPVAQAYEDRLTKLASDYKDKGVSVVAINVNKDSRNDLDAMKQRAEKKGFTFDYLTDPSQESARAYSATCTPHAFLLDGEGKIVYSGAIDDNMDAAAVKKHSLQDAVDAVLAGKAPEVTVTKQFGCGIHYE